MWQIRHVRCHNCVARYFVLYQMPRLRFLDSRAVTPSELKEAKRVGAYTKIVKPSNHMVSHLPLHTSCSYTFYL